LLVALGLAGVISAVALPMTSSAVSDLRVRGDARAVSNIVALAKMRATSGFTRTRVFVDLDGGSFFVQIWDKATSTWGTEGGARATSAGVSFGFGGLTAPPPDTQVAIGQSSACLDDEGTAIGNSACIVFNSRGIPIDAAGAPTGDNGLYITDGTSVYGTTITATPLVRLWWSPAGSPAWVRQ
jgi:hypothetical protein